MSARDTALKTLIACRRQNAWSDGALKQNIQADGLDRRDAALATKLCFGVLQNRLLLDAWIEAYTNRKPEKFQPVVLDILRLAVYQLRFLDKIPPSAAVNEAVEQTKRAANPRAAGLVNAALRGMLRSPDRLRLPADLSLKYSHPPALVKLLRENVGDDRLEPLLASHNAFPPTCLQVNTLQSTSEEVTAVLEREGYSVSAHPWLRDCLLLTGGTPEKSEVFRDGSVYVQDPAARLAVLAADPHPGMDVLDCCAAPGGKSFAAGIQMVGVGQITSCDLHPHKIELIKKGAERLNLGLIQAETRDASVSEPAWKHRFDLVIADVPCSGLGVIRKKPDIRYKELDALTKLPEIQGRILDNQANYVKPGGVLLYSTCTILKRENEEVVSAFLRTNPDFTLEAFELPGDLQAAEGMLTLLPCDQGTDGFFIAKLRRKS